MPSGARALQRASMEMEEARKRPAQNQHTVGRGMAPSVDSQEKGTAAGKGRKMVKEKRAASIG